MKIIKPRDTDQKPEGLTIFLAGSIDNGSAERWQDTVEKALADMKGTIFNPRRDNWLPDLKQDISEPEFAYQVNWELDHIEQADLVFFYFSPHGPAPITLMELGLAVDKTVVVCCPDGYWRKGNVQVLCDRRKTPLHDDLPSAIHALRVWAEWMDQ